MILMTRFGMVPLANEDAPIHPDASVVRTELLSNKEYQEMLENYRKHYGDEEAFNIAVSRYFVASK